LPYQVVRGWAQLPAGWNFGEVSAVDVDKNDNVWVFNRGPHPVIEFDKSGKMLQAWPEVPVKTAHGLRLDADGNVWTVDVDAHRVMKWTPSGRLLVMIGGVGGAAGNNDSNDGFNRPANLTFAPNGDFFVADGYVNSRVISFNKDGEYITHWGRKGTGDGVNNRIVKLNLDGQVQGVLSSYGKTPGNLDIAHYLAVDSTGAIYVAEIKNWRVQKFVK
jgi:hypothetical protein